MDFDKRADLKPLGVESPEKNRIEPVSDLETKRLQTEKLLSSEKFASSTGNSQREANSAIVDDSDKESTNKIVKDETVVEGLKQIWGDDVALHAIENLDILHTADPGKSAADLLEAVLDASAPDKPKDK